MSEYIIHQQMLPATELIETMTGSNVLIGTLIQAPVKIIFDNLGTVSVRIFLSYDSGTTLIPWKTFAAGSALVLDDDLYTFSRGVRIYGNGASGNFSIAYTYINQPVPY